MCVNKKRIFNRWTNSWQWVDCGHCPSCQQAKAFKRVKRIKNASYNGYIPLFVTLTYCNLCVPYVKVEDLLNGTSHINVYRDFDVRRVRCSSDYKMRYHRYRRNEPLATYDLFEKNLFMSRSDIEKLPRLRGRSKYVGVCYFKDLQDFQKRLSINLRRRYNIQDSIYYFQVSEYGSWSKRPHFHLLIYVPAQYLDECICAISEAWPFDYEGAVRGKKIQIARNAASYVSSYVNRGSDFPDFLSVSAFRPKCSFNQGFGSTSSVLSLFSIVRALGTGDLRYVGTRSVEGKLEDALIQYPKYALSRYFPYFKGRCRLPVDTLRLYLSCPARILAKEHEDIVMSLFMEYDGCHIPEYNGFMNQSVMKSLLTIYRTIENAYQRFIADFPILERDEKGIFHQYGYGLPDNLYSRELYAQYYTDVMRCYANTLYKGMFDGTKNLDDVIECYYNLDEVCGKHLSDIQDEIDKYPFHNPNQYNSIINSSLRLSRAYIKMQKQRHVTNISMVNQGINV